MPEGGADGDGVKLPRLGQGMESGVIVRWLKSEGDAVSSGEPLYELDTDKVTQEVEAEVDGTLLQIVVAEGEVAVGSTVAVIGDADSPHGEPAEPEAAADAEAESEPAAKGQPEPENADSPGARRGAGTRREAETEPEPGRPNRARTRPTCGSRPRRSRAGSRVSAGSTSQP